MGKTKIFLRLLFVAFPLGLVAPFLFSGSFQTSDDFHYHVVWHSLFKDQLLRGDFYPRWLIDQNDGFGAPTFRYYGPAAFYLSSLISLFLPGFSAGQEVAASAGVFILLSSLTCFFWLRRNFSEKTSLIVSIAYAVTPYHLAIDLYKRLAFAELLTFVWMPLILLSVERISSEEKGSFKNTNILMLAVSYSVLVLTHPPTTVIFSGVPFVYALAAASKDRVRQMLKVAVGIAIGLALSAVYLAPALIDQNLVRIDLHRTEYFDFRNWFLFPPVVPTKYNKTLAALSGLQLVMVIGTYAVCLKAGRQNNLRRSFWLVIALAACFMMSTPSRFLYELVSPLQQIQFSSRFNVLLLLSSSFIFAELVEISLHYSKGWRTYAGPSVLLIFLLFSSLVTYKMWLYMQDVSQSYATEQKIIKEGIKHNVIAGDFLPHGTPFLSPENLTLLSAVFNQGDSRAVSLKGEVRLNVLQWGPEEILINSEATEVSTLAIRQLYSKTHYAEVTDTKERLTVGALEGTNILSVVVPKGRSVVKIGHYPTRAETAGLLCSAVTLVLIVVFQVRYRFIR